VWFGFFCSFGRPVNPKKFLYIQNIQSAPRRSKTQNQRGREALNIFVIFLNSCCVVLLILKTKLAKL
jgi:VanZ family protein